MFVREEPAAGRVMRLLIIAALSIASLAGAQGARPPARPPLTDRSPIQIDSIHLPTPRVVVSTDTNDNCVPDEMETRQYANSTWEVVPSSFTLPHQRPVERLRFYCYPAVGSSAESLAVYVIPGFDSLHVQVRLYTLRGTLVDVLPTQHGDCASLTYASLHPSRWRLETYLLEVVGGGQRLTRKVSLGIR